MGLETMTPDPGEDPAGREATIEAFSRLDSTVTIKVWGDDGCVDCQEQLPGFAAVLDAAGIDPATVEQYPVERLPEGRKRGPKVEEYGVDRIPTIVIEQDGTEVARFVEEADAPAADYLARQLRDRGVSA